MDDDRLSELPDSLILVILSLLPTIDAIRTSILSKRWKDVWTTLPCLHFHNRPDGDLNTLRNFIYDALLHWRGAMILEFKIDFTFETHLTTCVDSLLLFAILNKSEELHVELTECTTVWPFEGIERSRNFCPPRCLYSCSFLTKLTLVSVQLDLGESVRWDRLKSLTIEGADWLTEHAMNLIVSGAPLLEDLNLRVKESDENLSIRSASLRRLKINMCGVEVAGNGAILMVYAPNLEALEISGLSYTRSLFHVPSLASAVLGFDDLDYFIMLEEMLVQVFISICHVQRLELTDWCIKVCSL